ncbi:MAG: bacillithiol biosynthesis cysteine-adding enzyme BshC [Lacibacter sp.]
MDCISHRLSYAQTGAFSKIVLDYLEGAEPVRSFYHHRPDLEGLKQAIEQRKLFSTKRNVLVGYLQKQYNTIESSDAVNSNIELLLKENTFTITTAHQPNLFTGPLYFIYKILHAIKSADELKKQLPAYNFVPVYYMGSEDADFEELSHFTVEGKKYQWSTTQSGAFGRMIIDKHITKLIDEVSGQLSIHPFGNEIIHALRESYKEKRSIQEATFAFVHFLFARFGLITIIADAKELKQLMIPVFEDELLNHTSSKLVEQTTYALEKHYKVQAGGREINLFYFDEDLRERIEALGDGFAVANTTIRFTKDQLLKELNEHPERFSPNVILRGLFQETILPNIAFIGGGGEIAYWLELKSVFDNYQVPYPVLLVRNSFLLAEKKWNNTIANLGFEINDFFLSEDELLNRLVKKESNNTIDLKSEIIKAEEFYTQLKNQAAQIDVTLTAHVDALKVKALHRLHELQKKMLRAEKRKFADQQRQIQAIKNQLFPNNSLQERKESFLSFYAKSGGSFINELYQLSPVLEQEFTVMTF